ncbi:MAG: DUF222 domain-containing protein [Gemmatimonadales bacterium]
MPGATRRRQLVARLAPEQADRFDPDAVMKRSCSIGTDWAGMGLYRLVLDPDTHLQISALIAQYSGPRPAGQARTGEGEVVTLPDPRTATQRRADAFTDLLLRGAGRPGWLASDHQAPQAPEAATSKTATPEAATFEAATFEAATPEAATPGSDAPGGGAPEAGAPRAGRSDSGETPAGGTTTGTTGGTPTGPTGPTDGTAGGAAGGATVDGSTVGSGSTAAQILVIATVDQVAAAFGASDPAARAARRARTGLAGNLGAHPGATVHPKVLARLACDTPLRRILLDSQGAVLHYGRAQRLASPHQKRALAVRDGGCAIPGCSAPPEWTDVHHIISWEHGGRTDVDAILPS